MATPATDIFDRILGAALRKGIAGREAMSAIDWFKAKTKQFGSNVTPAEIASEKERMRTRPEFGRMYFFFYDPKHKATLPYYDRFPMVFPIDPRPNGFLGINLHYLSYPLRAKLMSALWTTRNNDKYDESTKLTISYQILNSAARFAPFKPCVKWYLWDHVQSKFMRVESVEWNIALFLPVERFEKASKEKVWKDSRAMISANISAASKTKPKVTTPKPKKQPKRQPHILIPKAVPDRMKRTQPPKAATKAQPSKKSKGNSGGVLKPKKVPSLQDLRKGKRT